MGVAMLALLISPMSGAQSFGAITIGQDYDEVCRRLERSAAEPADMDYDHRLLCSANWSWGVPVYSFSRINLEGLDYDLVLSGLEQQVVEVLLHSSAFRSYSRAQLDHEVHAELHLVMTYLEEHHGNPFVNSALSSSTHIDSPFAVAVWDAGLAEVAVRVARHAGLTEAANEDRFVVMVEATHKAYAARLNRSLVGDYTEVDVARAEAEREREDRIRIGPDVNAFVQAMFGHLGIVQVVCPEDLGVSFACGESDLRETDFRQMWDLYADWESRLPAVPQPLTAWQRAEGVLSRTYLLHDHVFLVSYVHGSVVVARVL